MPGTTTERRVITLQLCCQTQPGPTGGTQPFEVGLQDKQGQLDAGMNLPDGKHRYECQAEAILKDGRLRLRGPHVHGPADAPFLYISLRDPSTSEGWIKRLKVPIKGITWDDLEPEDPTTLSAVIGGQGAATVPLLTPWQRTGTN